MKKESIHRNRHSRRALNVFVFGSIGLHYLLLMLHFMIVPHSISSLSGEFSHHQVQAVEASIALSQTGARVGTKDLQRVAEDSHCCVAPIGNHFQYNVGARASEIVFAATSDFKLGVQFGIYQLPHFSFSVLSIAPKHSPDWT